MTVSDPARMIRGMYLATGNPFQNAASAGVLSAAGYVLIATAVLVIGAAVVSRSLPGHRQNGRFRVRRTRYADGNLKITDFGKVVGSAATLLTGLVCAIIGTVQASNTWSLIGVVLFGLGIMALPLQLFRLLASTPNERRDESVSEKYPWHTGGGFRVLRTGNGGGNLRLTNFGKLVGSAATILTGAVWWIVGTVQASSTWVFIGMAVFAVGLWFLPPPLMRFLASTPDERREDASQ